MLWWSVKHNTLTQKRRFMSEYAKYQQACLNGCTNWIALPIWLKLSKISKGRSETIHWKIPFNEKSFLNYIIFFPGKLSSCMERKTKFTEWKMKAVSRIHPVKSSWKVFRTFLAQIFSEGKMKYLCP